MIKNLFNLLTTSTNNPISLGSTNGVDTFTGPIYVNDYGANGNVYVEVAGFATVTGVGFAPKIWHSFNGAAWFLHTELPTTDTSLSSSYALSNLGSYVRCSYATKVGSINGLSTVRMMLEVDVDYD